MAKKIAVAVGAVVLLLMSVLVWPTRYVQTSYADRPARIDRFTGEAEVLTRWGWTKATNQRAEQPAQIFGNPPPVQLEAPEVAPILRTEPKPKSASGYESPQNAAPPATPDPRTTNRFYSPPRNR